jgi:Lrp/AsnC family transcriptional regulator, regulator for asnA, asnC and gidA
MTAQEKPTARRRVPQPDPAVPEVDEVSTVDDTDRQIIRLLCANGRASNVEIAKSIGVTETTVRKRIARLLSTGAIEVVAIPSPSLAGLNLSAIIGISTELHSLRSVCRNLAALPEVRYCGYSTGRFDLIIEAFFADQAHVLSFTTDVLGAMDGITAVETSLILEIAKFSFDL